MDITKYTASIAIIHLALHTLKNLEMVQETITLDPNIPWTSNFKVRALILKNSIQHIYTNLEKQQQELAELIKGT